ncbi:MAG TPA: DUF3147 family protein [Thiobacillus sp.]
MGQTALKVILSALILVAIAEVAKRSTFWAAALASLPLTSLLAFVWLYLDTGDAQKVAALASGIFWLVLPSLLLFVLLPVLLRNGWGFWTSLAASSAATALAYLGMIKLLAAFGIRL